MTKYLRPKEVADLVGVTVETIYNWIKEGIIPIFRPKRSIFISEETLKELKLIQQ